MFIALLQDLCKKQYKKIYYIGTYTLKWSTGKMFK